MTTTPLIEKIMAAMLARCHSCTKPNNLAACKPCVEPAKASHAVFKAHYSQPANVDDGMVEACGNLMFPNLPIAMVLDNEKVTGDIKNTLAASIGAIKE